MDQLERYILDQPWPIIVLLAVLAGVVFLIGARKAAKKAFGCAVVLLVLAGVVFAAAMFINTARQRVKAQTRELVNATVPLDAAKIDAMLDPHATINLGGLPIPRDLVRPTLEGLVRGNNVKSNTITALDADARQGELINVHLGVSSQLEMLGSEGPVSTQWLLVWRQQPDGSWKVYRVQWERLNGQPPAAGLAP